MPRDRRNLGADDDLAVILLNLRLAAKATVYRLWREAEISKREFGRRMGRSERDVCRILDPCHDTNLHQIEEAARALGAQLAIDVASRFR
jgi:hypothetical protein